MLSSYRPATQRNKKWHRQHTSRRRRWQSYERLSAKSVSTANRKDAAEMWSCSRLLSHVLTSREEMELTPALICCVIETTKSFSCHCTASRWNHTSTLQSNGLLPERDGRAMSSRVYEITSKAVQKNMLEILSSVFLRILYISGKLFGRQEVLILM